MESAEELCADVNRRLGAVPFTYEERATTHVLRVDGGPPISFPHDAGGRVHGGSASWVSKKHHDGAIHEPGLVAVLAALADQDRPVRTFLDVGALYGYVSLVARSLFRDVEVHAFEANPRSYRALVNNFAANRGSLGAAMHAHLCALSDVSESGQRMRVRRMSVTAVPDEGVGTEPVGTQRVGTERVGTETGDDGVPRGIGESAGTVVELDLWSLDDFCREHALVPDVIKLDVEGYQAKIIPGAREVIRRAKPLILLEFDSPGAANDFGLSNRDVIAPLLCEDGYRLIWGKHRYTHVPFEVLELEDLTRKHEVNSLGVLLPPS